MFLFKCLHVWFDFIQYEMYFPVILGKIYMYSSYCVKIHRIYTKYEEIYTMSCRHENDWLIFVHVYLRLKLHKLYEQTQLCEIYLCKVHRSFMEYAHLIICNISEVYENEKFHNFLSITLSNVYIVTYM